MRVLRMIMSRIVMDIRQRHPELRNEVIGTMVSDAEIRFVPTVNNRRPNVEVSVNYGNKLMYNFQYDGSSGVLLSASTYGVQRIAV